MNRDAQADAGRLLLRLLVGGLMLFHGMAKVRHGTARIANDLVEHGLPAVMQYGVYVGEVAAPFLIVVGVWTRAAALVEAFNLVVAVYLVHTHQFFTLGQAGGWALELQALYLVGAIAIALLGAGRFSAGGEHGHAN